MKSILILFTAALLVACHTAPESADQKTYPPKVIKSAEGEIPQHRLQVDTNKIYSGENFYQLIPVTDSTSRLKWGNKSANYTSPKVFENWMLSEKMWLDWSNNKFIVLAFDMGNDSWYNVVLPFANGKGPEFFWRPIAFDHENGIIVSAYGVGPDSILLATDVLTNKIQPVGKGWKTCQDTHGPHYCVDSVSIANKQLYVQWNGEVKRIKLSL
jgi:hypothetical protein